MNPARWAEAESQKVIVINRATLDDAHVTVEQYIQSLNNDTEDDYGKVINLATAAALLSPDSSRQFNALLDAAALAIKLQNFKVGRALTTYVVTRVRDNRNRRSYGSEIVAISGKLREARDHLRLEADDPQDAELAGLYGKAS